MDFKTSVKRDSAERRSLCTSVILSVAPGIVAFGCLVAAVALPQWMAIYRFTGSLQINTFGLFSVCLEQFNGGEPQCLTREEHAAAGSSIDVLEQATRSLVIISIILHLPSIVAGVYFGLRRNTRKFSPLIPGGIFGISGLCAISGMACYSAYLISTIADANTATSSAGESVHAMTSFFLGWFGAVSSLLASIICFASYAIN